MLDGNAAKMVQNRLICFSVSVISFLCQVNTAKNIKSRRQVAAFFALLNFLRLLFFHESVVADIGILLDRCCRQLNSRHAKRLRELECDLHAVDVAIV